MSIKKYIPLRFKQRARAIQKQFKLISSKLYCPVCESSVVSFLPLPEFFRDNQQKFGFPFNASDSETCNEAAYLCPSCGATDRDRLYALFLCDYFAKLQKTTPISIVDFAPSQALSMFIQRLIKSSRKKIQYRTADLLAQDVDDRIDITDLHTYETDQFALFICSHVLEHVTDDRKALRELHRILKPGGHGILMVPIISSLEEIDEDPTVNEESERWRRFGQFDHVRLYSKRGFLERVHEADFKVTELGKDFFGEQLFDRMGINRQSVLYIVEKE
jgi:SAM-dependent methyltransferase